MSPRGSLLVLGLLLLPGCSWAVQEHVELAVADIAAHPLDPDPPEPLKSVKPPAEKKAGGAAPAATDARAAAWMQGDRLPGENPERGLPLEIPQEIPGAETSPLKVPRDPEERRREIRRLYPDLPPLPAAPEPLPGPDGKPYTLADLQRLAAENSPALVQAAADVETARGNLIQARAYPNPTVGYEADPSNDGSTAGVQGIYVDQVIKKAGKLKLQAAAAEKDLENAELALRRARSDLATQVRTAYFAHLAAKESVRITRALARLADEVYRVQERLAEVGLAAAYEPAALRAQAYTSRLALKQAIATDAYTWKELVAAIGLRQLPLAEVAGRLDVAIPYFDYDAVLAHVLRGHTDVLTARNGIEKARYNLMLAQVTPIPDVDVRVAVLKEFALPPFQMVHTVQVGMPLPVWDQNKGNIIAAQGSQVRAGEEPHRVELTLTNNLATAYQNYKNNLDALEYYRRFILPDQVRTYRGVYERRQAQPAAVALADLVTAQQTLATFVTGYLTVLGQLWASAVSVADLLQTDDLFQVATPCEVPALPDLEHLPELPCCHAPVAPAASGPAGAAGCRPPSPPPTPPLPGPPLEALSVPRPLPGPATAPAVKPAAPPPAGPAPGR
jgi:outer membrane protein, heavy metal efflux system